MFSKNTFYALLGVIIIATIILYYSTTHGNEEKTFYFKLINEENETNVNIPIDNTQIIDRKVFNLNLQYVINSNPCENTSKILYIVTSYFGNVETRSAMRRAFSQQELNDFKFRRVFLLGLSPTDKYTTQKAIENEANRFGDIVQGNFQEAYRNLTYKHMMGLKWSYEYCNNVKYVIKMDDDIVVNIRKFSDVIENINFPNKNFLAGYILRGLKAKRDPVNKWYVTKDEYHPSVYPIFVSGWFYVTNIVTIGKLIFVSRIEKYFWIDDVLITGILAKKVKVRHYDISKYFTVHSEFLQCCLNDVKKDINCDILIGPNGGDNNLFYVFNEQLKKCNTRNVCHSRTKSLNETCVAERKVNLGKGNAVVSRYQLH